MRKSQNKHFRISTRKTELYFKITISLKFIQWQGRVQTGTLFQLSLRSLISHLNKIFLISITIFRNLNSTT